MKDTDVEQMIQAKGKTAPRILPADIEANIVACYYFTAADGVNGRILHTGGSWADAIMPDSMALLTFCVLVLKNGHRVVGINYGAIDPAQHDPEMGREEAHKKAVDKVYEFLAYELRTKLAGGEA